jgi:hypothetical protein
MKHREPNRHPGIMCVMQVDSEVAGILIAVGFVLMGLVSMPIAKWFFLGAVLFGVVVALVLRWTKRDKPLQSIGLGSPPPQDSQETSVERQAGCLGRAQRLEGTSSRGAPRNPVRVQHPPASFPTGFVQASGRRVLQPGSACASLRSR